MKQIRAAWGDITKLPCDGIVSRAKELLHGKIEPDEYIAALAGAELREAFDKAEMCGVAGFRVTKGGKLSAKYVIHTLWEDREEPDKKRKERVEGYYEAILKIANEKRIKCLAIPTLKIGTSRNSLSEGIAVAVQSVCDWIRKNRCSMEVVFCAETKEEFELYQIFYPVCSWSGEQKFETVVMDIIEQLGNTTVLNTREKALVVVRDMLSRALETKKEKVIQVYRRLEYEMETATDAEYDLLYRQCQSDLEESGNTKAEPFSVRVLRRAFQHGMRFLTKPAVRAFFEISDAQAERALRCLVNRNYINIDHFEGNLILYKVLISKEDFYLIHGE